MLVRGILRTQSNFYDGPFLRKQLATFQRYFSEKSSMVDVLLGSNYDVKEFSRSNILGSKYASAHNCPVRTTLGPSKRKLWSFGCGKPITPFMKWNISSSERGLIIYWLQDPLKTISRRKNFHNTSIPRPEWNKEKMHRQDLAVLVVHSHKHYLFWFFIAGLVFIYYRYS